MTARRPSIDAVATGEAFAVAPGDEAGYAAEVAAIWEDGDGRREWSFVASVAGEPVARVGYLVTDSVTDPAWLGTLPPKELGVFGLAAWGDDPAGTLEDLMRRTIASTGAGLTLELRANPALHGDVELRRVMADRLGLALFQEKEGMLWVDDGSPIEVPDRLTFRTIADVGHDRYREVMGGPGNGTLDRNDAWYHGHVGPSNWGAQMMVYFEEGDEDSWLIAEIDGDAVGYVAVSSFDDEGTATIAHIGVMPRHRGNGYVNDLLAAGTAAARTAGFTRILSDVDVLNAPMLAAMERAGHHAAATPWHLWSYRGVVSPAVD